MLLLRLHLQPAHRRKAATEGNCSQVEILRSRDIDRYKSPPHLWPCLFPGGQAARLLAPVGFSHPCGLLAIDPAFPSGDWPPLIAHAHSDRVVATVRMHRTMPAARQRR